MHFPHVCLPPTRPPRPCTLRSAPFIHPVNIAMTLFKRLDDNINQLHFSATPLAGVFNAPNFTGAQPHPAPTRPSVDGCLHACTPG